MSKETKPDKHGISVSQVAKSFGLSRNDLFRILREAGVLMVDGERRNEPYQKFIDDGAFVVRVRKKDVKDETRSFATTFVTTHGVERIRKYLTAKGFIKDLKRYKSLIVLLRHGDLGPVIYYGANDDLAAVKKEAASLTKKLQGCTAIAYSEQDFLASKEPSIQALIKEYKETRFVNEEPKPKSKKKKNAVDPRQESLF
jgi:transcriptional regulator of acetoin/glycerol metabolism